MKTLKCHMLQSNLKIKLSEKKIKVPGQRHEQTDRATGSKSPPQQIKHFSTATSLGGQRRIAETRISCNEAATPKTKPRNFIMANANSPSANMNNQPWLDAHSSQTQTHANQRSSRKNLLGTEGRSNRQTTITYTQAEIPQKPFNRASTFSRR